LAEYYGSGALYDSAEALRILGQCRLVAVTRASTNEIQMERYFHRERWEKRPLAPFFTGEITYSGELSQDIMALLELGRMIHVGKMATFGNGGYEIGVRG
jgi:CRISPR/Cas system endoribonuclease Cas6 (RAMP superfamily)